MIKKIKSWNILKYVVVKASLEPRLWHKSYIYTCLNHYRHARKSMPCLIKKASRCVADHMSKTTTFLSSTFIKYKYFMIKSGV